MHTHTGSALVNLFSPLDVGPLRLANRIVSTAHGTSLASDYMPSDGHVAYYEERARGGVGLIVMEGLRVHPTSTFNTTSMNGFDPRIVPRLAAIPEACHRHGVPVVAQILHAGRQMRGTASGLPIWAPSSLACPQNREIPHAVDRSEIREVVEGFRITAEHCQAAGLDGVEIHAAHGYLLQEFMSPLTNRRADEYGETLDNRLRIVREVVDAIRTMAGDGFAIGLRLSADEFTDGGLGVTDMEDIARALVQGSQLDYLSVSQSNYVADSYATMIPDMHFARNTFTELAATIRSAIDQAVPVVTVGRIVDPVDADRIIGEGSADLAGMCRALIADPHLPRKAASDELHDIRGCIGCNQGCVGMVHASLPIRCVQNAVTGRESRFTQTRFPESAETPKRVVVVGGGPAGMECARVLRRRGHEVTLFEGEAELGGQLRPLLCAPQRSEWRGCLDFLTDQVERLGVEIQLGVQATVADVREQRPDAIVITAGSRPRHGELAGLADDRSFTVWEAVQAPDRLGSRVVIVDQDGHFRAAATAEMLADRGLAVEIWTPFLHVGVDIPGVSLNGLLFRLGRKSVSVRPHTRPSVWKDGRLYGVDALGGSEEAMAEPDTIVWALPQQAQDDLWRELREDAGAAVYAAGDCVAPRTALEAIREGHDVAWAI